MVVCNLCGRSLADVCVGALVLACPFDLYHEQCSPLLSKCPICVAGPVIMLSTNDKIAPCGLCFVDRGHATEKCIRKIADSITHTINNTVAGIEIGPEITRILNSHSTTRVDNVHYLHYITKTLTDILTHAPTLDEYSVGFVRTKFATALIAAKKQIPTDGNWHPTTNMSPDLITWIRGSNNTGVCIKKLTSTSPFVIRHNTSYNIDSARQLQTTLAEMYPVGIDKFELFCEHDDMAAWIIRAGSDLVVIEGIKDTSIVYCSVSIPGSIHAAVANLYGEPCAMFIDAVREHPCFDYTCLPQIHASVRAAIIRDLHAARLIEFLGCVRPLTPVLIGINNKQLNSDFPKQISTENKNTTNINVSNCALASKRRRISTFVNRRFRPTHL